MDDELDTFGCRQTYLEHPPVLVGADQHRELIEGEDSDRVSIGVKYIGISDTVLSGVYQDDGVHSRQYILIPAAKSSEGPMSLCRPTPNRSDVLQGGPVSGEVPVVLHAPKGGAHLGEVVVRDHCGDRPGRSDYRRAGSRSPSRRRKGPQTKGTYASTRRQRRASWRRARSRPGSRRGRLAGYYPS